MEKQYRYPGTRPFQEEDRNLFFGRKKDIEKLTELIVLEKMVVLFSKSGYGKSSLLNAGVIPRLKEVENLETLTIRLNDPERYPVELLCFHLENKIAQSTFLESKFNVSVELPDDISAKLWYYAKSIQLAQKDAQEIVLIFDQFEELFNYSPDQVKDFAYELAILLNPNLIPSVRSLFKQKTATSKDYFTKEEANLLLEPLHLKVVFSLRSDRISLLHQLKESIPAVFKKTYELLPLNVEQAREALLEPAGKEGDFASPMFTYAEDAISLILNSLKDKENEWIETFQLQLICQHAEELIIGKVSPDSERLELTAEELGNPEDIFENHYNTIIGNLPPDSQHIARILIEDKLIIGGNRVPLPESVIIEEHKITADLLKTLVDKRLLRSEPNTVGGLSFELSHDTLVAPIQKTAKTRRLEEAEERAEKEKLEKAEIQRKLTKTRALLITAGIALIIAIIAVFIADASSRKAKDAQRAALISEASAKDAQEEALNLLEVAERAKQAEVAAAGAAIKAKEEAESNFKKLKQTQTAKEKIEFDGLESRAKIIIDAGGCPFDIVIEMDKLFANNKEIAEWKEKINSIKGIIKDNPNCK